MAPTAADPATEAGAASAAGVQHDDGASATCELGVGVPGKGVVQGRAVTERAVGTMAQAGAVVKSGRVPQGTLGDRRSQKSRFSITERCASYRGTTSSPHLSFITCCGMLRSWA